MTEGTLYYDMEKVSAQIQSVPSANQTSLQFNVPQSTYALACAYIDGRAGDDSRISPTKFHAKKNTKSAATNSEQEEDKLSRWYLSIGGKNYPARESSPDFNTGKDYSVARYAQTMINNGAYWDNASAETLQEYKERGMYLYEPIHRDGSNVDSRVLVNSEFSRNGGAEIANMNCCLFAFSRKVAKCDYKNGRLVEITVQEA